eukprot:1156445-Rhodomonas_salina.1
MFIRASCQRNQHSHQTTAPAGNLAVEDNEDEDEDDEDQLSEDSDLGGDTAAERWARFRVPKCVRHCVAVAVNPVNAYMEQMNTDIGNYVSRNERGDGQAYKAAQQWYINWCWSRARMCASKHLTKDPKCYGYPYA